MYKTTLTFIIGSILLSCSTIKKQLPVENPQLAEFDKFITDVKNNYIYLETRMEEYDCIKESYRNGAANLSEWNDHVLFYEIIMMEFWDSHVHLGANTKESYRLDYPIYSEFENNVTTIKGLWQTQLANLPEENIMGAEILSFNGKPFQEVIDDFPTQCLDKNNPLIRTWIGNKIIAGKYTQARELQLKLINGITSYLNVDSLKIYSENSFLNYTRLDNIAYIRINNSLGESGLVDEFNQTLNELMDTEALILDLRNTEDGGNTSVALPILGRFIAEKKPYQRYEDKEKEYVGYVEPNGTTYTKPIYVLVNHWTGSMGEGMAIAIDGMERGSVIGTEMNRLRGGMKDFKFSTFDYSYKFSFEKIFHVDGTPREAFVPDIYVIQSQHKKDETLGKALEIIREN